MRISEIYSLSISNMQYSVVNYSHHATHYIPRTYLFITRSLCLLTHFSHAHTLTSDNHQSVLVSVAISLGGGFGLDFTYKSVLSFSVSLISLHMMPSRSIPANSKSSFFRAE